MAGSKEARVTVLRVVPPGEEVDCEAEEAAVESFLQDELSGSTSHVCARVVQASSVTAGILNAAGQGYELLIIGASEQWFLRNWLFGAIPDEVAKQAPCSVLLVKKCEPASVPWLRRLVKGVIT